MHRYSKQRKDLVDIRISYYVYIPCTRIIYWSALIRSFFFYSDSPIKKRISETWRVIQLNTGHLTFSIEGIWFFLYVSISAIWHWYFTNWFSETENIYSRLWSLYKFLSFIKLRNNIMCTRIKTTHIMHGFSFVLIFHFIPKDFQLQFQSKK